MLKVHPIVKIVLIIMMIMVQQVIMREWQLKYVVQYWQDQINNK